MEYPPDLKSKIERLLSEILSEQHDCKVVLKFVPIEKEKEGDKLEHARPEGNGYGIV